MDSPTRHERRFSRLRHAAATLLGLGVLLAAAAAFAVPRYSARYEQNCMLCHVNPTGGGMRSEYAVQDLIPNEIAMSAHGSGVLAALDTHLNKSIRIGADFRNQFMLESEHSAQGSQQGFFPMQADLHVSFQLDPRYLLYFKKGRAETYEYYYLGHLLPFDGYVKGGRFVPPYGWKFDDHTMYVRSDLGFAPPANSDAGIEAGLAPKWGDVQVAVTNGSRGALLDNDRRLAVSAVGGVRFRAGPLSAYAGLSGYAQPGRTEDLGMAGAFGSLHGWGLTWVGQADRVRRHPFNGPATTAAVSSHELSLALARGVEMLGTFDWYDPDLDLATGSRSRWGVGFKAMPKPFMAAELLYRRTEHQNGLALPGTDFDEGVFQLHLLY